jgi:hypothetical protein
MGGDVGILDDPAMVNDRVAHEVQLLSWGMGNAGPALLIAICQALSAALPGSTAEQVISSLAPISAEIVSFARPLAVSGACWKLAHAKLLA